jgi:hypothetical protein
MNNQFSLVHVLFLNKLENPPRKRNKKREIKLIDSILDIAYESFLDSSSGGFLSHFCDINSFAPQNSVKLIRLTRKTKRVDYQCGRAIENGEN